MSENKKNWVVFTDLDGTLLDAQTYSYLPALEAIQLLKEKHIPLIFCTSKTFSEARALQQQMGISDPFIVENGSA
ncbi:MAG TPA: HAD-IIB family hydrolase, partial [Caldithrix abyssi]|nr:HAD-IIB family hydrolase [Caldithrix abyssi]